MGNKLVLIILMCFPTFILKVSPLPKIQGTVKKYCTCRFCSQSRTIRQYLHPSPPSPKVQQGQHLPIPSPISVSFSHFFSQIATSRQRSCMANSKRKFKLLCAKHSYSLKYINVRTALRLLICFYGFIL